jgi:hypothetical protein
MAAWTGLTDNKKYQPVLNIRGLFFPDEYAKQKSWRSLCRGFFLLSVNLVKTSILCLISCHFFCYLNTFVLYLTCTNKSTTISLCFYS